MLHFAQINYRRATVRLLSYAAIIVTAVVANKYALSRHNFFLEDDFGWLRETTFRPIDSWFTLLPRAPYNDRPVGALFIHLLFQLFGYNHQWHHAVLMGVHCCSGIFLLHAIRKMLPEFVPTAPERFAALPLLSAMLFVGWPWSTLCVAWDAAALDLLAGFFVTLFFLLYATARDGKYPLFDTLLLGFLYLLALRSKEMTVVLPVLIWCIEVALNFIHKRPLLYAKPWTLARLVMLFAMMTTYLIAIRLAAIAHPLSADPHHPYFLSFHAIDMMRNVWNYILFYYDISRYSPLSIPPKAAGLLLTIPFAAFCLVALVLFCVRRRNIIPLLLLVLFVVQLSPVLPMKVMQHRLYLYLPSMFLSIIGAGICIMIVPRIRRVPAWRPVVAFLMVAASLYGAARGAGPRRYRQEWLGIADESHRGFNRLFTLKKPSADRPILVINMPPGARGTNVLGYGPGCVMEAIYGIPHLDMQLINIGPESQEALKRTDCDIINYNHADMIQIR